MTANRRIFLNIVATYGRSLYALVIGLIAGRWTLMSLGEIDYGLMGLVGGLTAFVTFLNGLMAGAVGRFYAFSVGEAQANPIEGIQKCREWFSTAILIHTTLPFVLILIGYPCGIWVVENFLNIPTDRIYACVWVWRFVCLSSFVSMASVPFSAMYNAKQEIAELTFYGVASTTINFLFLCYMITHPGSWLVCYAAWTCLIAIAPQLIICVRAYFVFAECRFTARNLCDGGRIKDLLRFAAGRFICALSLMAWSQGRMILVNKFLGPARNAAMTIGTTLSVQATTLMGAMNGAFSPAIMNACGAGKTDQMRKLCFKACKFGTFSVVIFAVPLILEADNVLVLWLKNPPVGASSLCVCLLIEHCISRMVDGHVMGVFAVGKMAGFNATECIGYFASIFVSWGLLLRTNLDIVSIGLAVITCSFYTVLVKLYFGRKNCGLSVLYWICHVMFPIVTIVGISLLIGFVVRSLFPATLLRVVLTTVVCEVVIFPLTWVMLCDKIEKEFLVSKFKTILKL